MKTLTPLIVLLSALGLVTGCATAGYKKADTASSSLRDAALGVDRSSLQLDVTLDALSDLVNSPHADIKPQFNAFSAALDKLESLSSEVTGHAAAMQEQGAAYFKNWDLELAKIQNEDIRTRSQDRKNAVAARFERVRVSYVQTRTDFAPLMTDLRDIRTALATDLTTGGLASVRSVSGKASRSASPLRVSLGGLAEDFKALGLSLSATTPAS